MHKARLKDGRIVAVKISHPNIESKFAVDLGIMRFFARFVSKKYSHYGWICKDTKLRIFFFVNQDNFATRNEMDSNGCSVRTVLDHNVKSIEFIIGSEELVAVQ